MEKLLFEFMSRVKALEEKDYNIQILESRVDELEKKLKALEMKGIEELENNLEDDAKVTRTTTRKYIMDQLEKMNPGVNATKGSKAKGSDIILSKNGKDLNLKIKFYHSKSYNESIPAGWNTVNIEDIQGKKYDLYIFCIAFKNDFKTFLFTNEDMKKITSTKQMDVNNNYHFYIQMTEDGKIVECRDSEKDISKNFENWTILNAI